MMEPKILERGAFNALGAVSRVARGTETPEMFRAIWEQFETFRTSIEPHSPDRMYYGISFPAAEEGVFHYLAGMAVERVSKAPEGLEIREVPAGKYAVFECALQAIGQTYQYAFGTWLPRSGYRLRPAASAFELYPPPEQEGACVQIHIPIEGV